MPEVFTNEEKQDENIYQNPLTGLTNYSQSSPSAFSPYTQSKYFIQQPNGDLTIGDTTINQYVQWDQSAATLTVKGALTVSSIDIPDTTTANSFHVDSSGNAWWGATTLAASNAKVLNTGAATFSSITANNSTLTFNDVFGDGSDGAATISSNTTLTRDVFYTTLTVNSGFTLTTAGYRIFCNTSATVNGTIDRSGTTGTVGNNASGVSGGTAGAAGSGLTAGSLAGSATPSASTNGANGAGGGNTDGTQAGGPSAAAAETNLIKATGTSGVAGGKGGNSNTNTGGASRAGAAATTGTQSVTNPKTSALGTLMIDTASTYAQLKSNNATSGSAGGSSGATGTGGSNSGGGGGGGGAGSNGGILVLAAPTITISATGVIQAKGGAGGNGGNGAASTQTNDGGGGGGGGGSGGSGGVVVLIYKTLSNSGTISVAGGAGGTGGTGGAAGGAGGQAGDPGVSGTTGTSGTSIQLQV